METATAEMRVAVSSPRDRREELIKTDVTQHTIQSVTGELIFRGLLNRLCWHSCLVHTEGTLQYKPGFSRKPSLVIVARRPQLFAAFQE